jgi:hypothetical protein
MSQVDALPKPGFDRLVLAGVVTSLVDGAFSGMLAAFVYGSSVTRLFQGVAATLVGSRAFEGGWGTAALGMLMHVGVAFGWSTILFLSARRLPALRQRLSTWPGVMGVAVCYGPCIWLVMSLVVIPALTQRFPTIGMRWWVQLIGHAPFVGLPIAASIGQPRSVNRGQ